MSDEITRQDVMNEVSKIIEEDMGYQYWGPVEITEDTTFDSLDFDSLDKAEMIMSLEEKFDLPMLGLEFPEKGGARIGEILDAVQDILSSKSKKLAPAEPIEPEEKPRSFSGNVIAPDFRKKRKWNNISKSTPDGQSIRRRMASRAGLLFKPNL